MHSNRFLSPGSRIQRPAPGRWLGGYDDDRSNFDDDEQPHIDRYGDWRIPDDPDDDEPFDPEPSSDGYDDFDFDSDFSTDDADLAENPPDEFWNEADWD